MTPEVVCASAWSYPSPARARMRGAFQLAARSERLDPVAGAAGDGLNRQRWVDAAHGGKDRSVDIQLAAA